MAVFVGRDGEDAPAGALYSKVSIYGAVFLSLSIVLLTGLHAYDVQASGKLTAEDSWVENGTAFLFFLTALLLLEAAASRRPAWPYMLGALAFVFAAGEEISWGQRVFLFETPDYLREMNRQDEFNLHNIEGLERLFYRVCRTSIQKWTPIIGQGDKCTPPPLVRQLHAALGHEPLSAYTASGVLRPRP